MTTPIPMILHCPKCGTQHIDQPDDYCPHSGDECPEEPHWHPGAWTNPPHRSHWCDACGFVWRPADVPTIGVATIQTAGKDDGCYLTARIKTT